MASSKKASVLAAAGTQAAATAAESFLHPPARAVATARFWDTRAAKNTATVSTPGSNLYLCYAPDGHYAAVGNREDTVSIIDIRCVQR